MSDEKHSSAWLQSALTRLLKGRAISQQGTVHEEHTEADGVCYLGLGRIAPSVADGQTAAGHCAGGNAADDLAHSNAATLVGSALEGSLDMSAESPSFHSLII
jgi:hypothetical protein